jgi:hypothetical protein
MMIFLINDNGWSHWRSCLYLADKNMIFFQFVSDHIFPGISWAQSSISHGCIALLAPSHYPSSPHFSLAVYPIFKIDSEPPLWFSHQKIHETVMVVPIFPLKKGPRGTDGPGGVGLSTQPHHHPEALGFHGWDVRASGMRSQLGRGIFNFVIWLELQPAFLCWWFGSVLSVANLPQKALEGNVRSVGWAMTVACKDNQHENQS